MYAIAGGDIESQLRLRDEMIYNLKQKVTSLTEEKGNAIFEIDRLRSLLDQAPIEEDGMY